MHCSLQHQPRDVQAPLTFRHALPEEMAPTAQAARRALSSDVIASTILGFLAPPRASSPLVRPVLTRLLLQDDEWWEGLAAKGLRLSAQVRHLRWWQLQGVPGDEVWKLLQDGSWHLPSLGQNGLLIDTALEMAHLIQVLRLTADAPLTRQHSHCPCLTIPGLPPLQHEELVSRSLCEVSFNAADIRQVDALEVVDDGPEVACVAIPSSSVVLPGYPGFLLQLVLYKDLSFGWLLGPEVHVDGKVQMLPSEWRSFLAVEVFLLRSGVTGVARFSGYTSDLEDSSISLNKVCATDAPAWALLLGLPDRELTVRCAVSTWAYH
uniref:Uncharacterized protein n=1 Tax=Alexandrium monilatum TaxID=311494 RepID=A0A7S4QVX3_9DINO